MSAPTPAGRVQPTNAGLDQKGNQNRFLRLHAFEFIIFVVMFVLLALCLAAAPLITRDHIQSPPPTP